MKDYYRKWVKKEGADDRVNAIKHLVKCRVYVFT